MLILDTIKTSMGKRLQESSGSGGGALWLATGVTLSALSAGIMGWFSGSVAAGWTAVAVGTGWITAHHVMGWPPLADLQKLVGDSLGYAYARIQGVGQPGEVGVWQNYTTLKEFSHTAAALRRLSDLPGVPRLMAVDRSSRTVVVSVLDTSHGLMGANSIFDFFNPKTQEALESWLAEIHRCGVTLGQFTFGDFTVEQGQPVLVELPAGMRVHNPESRSCQRAKLEDRVRMHALFRTTL